jgi:hypothetical protein
MNKMPPGRIDPIAFEAHIRKTMPKDVELDPWTKDAQTLVVRSAVRHKGCTVPIVIGFFDLKSRPPTKQAEFLWNTITDAINEVRKKAEMQCRVP